MDSPHSLCKHALHAGLPPRNMSRASTGDTSRQNGHNAMTASHSSLHPHRLQLFSKHAQHIDWVQQARWVREWPHLSAAQNELAQM